MNLEKFYNKEPLLMGNLLKGVDDNFEKVSTRIEQTGTYLLEGYKDGGTYYFVQNEIPATTGVYSVIVPFDSHYYRDDIFVITICGKSIQFTAKIPDGETLEDGSFLAGSKVPAILDLDNKVINFRLAGSKLKLSAESYVMARCFSEADVDEKGEAIYIIPKSGIYRILCIGKGGDGSKAVKEMGGGAGGAGGAGQVVVKLFKGQRLNLTINKAITSVNDYDKNITYITSGCGSNANNQYGGNYGACEINQNVCIAYQYFTSNKGEDGKQGISVNKIQGYKNTTAGINAANIMDRGNQGRGGNGGGYSVDESKFLSKLGTYGAEPFTTENTYEEDSYSNYPTKVYPELRLNPQLPYKTSISGLAPFGIGGGGGGCCRIGLWGPNTYGSEDYVDYCTNGSDGVSGAVIFEYATDITEAGFVEDMPTVTLNYNTSLTVGVGEGVTLWASVDSDDDYYVRSLTYKWYKNGVLIDNEDDYPVDLYTGQEKQPYLTLFELNEEDSGEYSVIVNDGERSSVVSTIINVVPGYINLSGGKSYEYTGEADKNEAGTNNVVADNKPYNERPDTNNEELTDGKITKYRYWKPEVNKPESEEADWYVGFKAVANPEIVIDLEDFRTINRVSTYMLSTEDKDSLRFVESVEFYYLKPNTDNTWEKFGTWYYRGPNYETKTDQINKYLCGVVNAASENDVGVISNKIKVKYNKRFGINGGSPGMTFISEIQVFGK